MNDFLDDFIGEWTFHDLYPDLRKEGIPTIWVVSEDIGEYDDAMSVPVGAVRTKEEARELITKLYAERELIIPEKIYELAVKEHEKEYGKMSENGATEDELCNFDCEPQVFFAKKHPAWTEEQWRHDYDIHNDYRFNSYSAEEINFYDNI